MKFDPTPLNGAWIITLEPIGDERGGFARTFCRKEFETHGIQLEVVQCNSSFNRMAGTLRGMHFQREPFAEPKLVRCIHGSLYDVIVDLRPDSPTYLQHFGVELSVDNLKMLFVPANFAHGFLTLKDHTEVSYLMGEFYAPEYAAGLRYDDPALGIEWPMPVRAINEKDLNWPLVDDQQL